MSADLRKKIEVWRRQHAALQAPCYRVSLIGRSGSAEGKRINLGKSRDESGPERFYSNQDVEKLLPQLRWHNASGFDVYVTPIDPAHHYLVVDDMKPGAANLLGGLGFSPCLVQSSSLDNEQAVVKVQKVARDDEQTLANNLVQQLNREHGDPNFSGVVHPFRMAGFSNKKPGREGVFTRILEAGHRLCSKAAELLRVLRRAADAALAKRKRGQERERLEAEAVREAERNRHREDLEIVFEEADDPVRAFQRAVAGVREWVKLKRLSEDASRVDYRAALAMLRVGWSDAEVRAGMLAGSDDLAKRHSNFHDYVHRTVRNAEAELSTKRASEASMPGIERPRS